MSKEADDCVKCPSCSSTWFEHVEAYQVLDDHIVVLGQKPPTKLSVGFILLKCLRCANVLEPRIMHEPRVAGKTLYDDLLDTLQKQEANAKVPKE